MDQADNDEIKELIKAVIVCVEEYVVSLTNLIDCSLFLQAEAKAAKSAAPAPAPVPVAVTSETTGTDARTLTDKVRLLNFDRDRLIRLERD